MSSNPPTLLDYSLGASSMISSGIIATAFLSMNVEHPSQTVDSTVQILRDLGVPYPHFESPLAVCIMCIVVFCSTQLAITLRRRLPPAISILVLLPGLLARVTIAEYVLICLPATWSLFELSHLVYQSVQEKGQEPIPAYMPKDYKEKDHVFA